MLIRDGGVSCVSLTSQAQDVDGLGYLCVSETAAAHENVADVFLHALANACETQENLGQWETMSLASRGTPPIVSDIRG